MFLAEMSFREELSQLARQEELLRQTCQTTEFIQFYKEQKEALREHVKNESKTDFEIRMLGSPAYFQSCLIKELKKDGLQTKTKHVDAYFDTFSILNVPSSQWK